jgi:23S rRNA (cytosine1962-C5)-methyltransferase
MPGPDIDSTLVYLGSAIEARAGLIEQAHENAFRLFSGFFEGCPDLAVDVYASTLVIHNYSESGEGQACWLEKVQSLCLARLPWITTVIVKTRNSSDLQNRRGQITFGDSPDAKIHEHGVWYAIDLLINQDASFYLDTRGLRCWLLDHMRGKTVLNTFAYTGSLGVAAAAGGASRVVQLDRSRAFLDLAAASYRLNGFPIKQKDFMVGDFFPQIGRLRHTGTAFDCVLVDPPFFAVTPKGRVDLAGGSRRLINKVRPLVSHNGYLVAVNNALYVSGADYLAELQGLCADGYLAIDEFIPIPADFTGYEQTRKTTPLIDPSPFNHSTKIAILKVKKRYLSYKTW